MKLQSFPILVMLAIYLSLLNCSGSVDSKIDAAIQKLKKGDINAQKELESLILNKIADDNETFEPKHLNEKYVYTIDQDDINISYPHRKSIHINGSNIIGFDADDENAVFTNGKDILINNETNPVVSVPDKDGIKSLLLWDNKIIYYYKYQIYAYDMNLKTYDLVIKDSILPPYKKYYSVTLHRSDSMLCVITGVAGSYNLVVVDTMQPGIKCRINTSSSRFMLNGDSVYYIGGATGSWKVYKYSIRSKQKNLLESITDITDFYFAQNGYIYENKKGLNLSDFNKKINGINLSYKLIGICKDTVFLEYNGNVYLTDFIKFWNSIEVFYSKLLQ